MLDPDRPKSQREIASAIGSIVQATTVEEEPMTSEDAEPDTPEEPDALIDTDEVDDEDAEVEAEAAEDEEVDADDEPDPEATDDDAFSLDLVVNGEEYSVTDRAEAIKLAQLGKHFTNLREEQVQREKEIAQERSQLQQERQHYAQALPVLEKFLSAPLGDPPDPNQFDDQAQYLFAKDQYNEQLQNVQAVRAEMQRVQQEQQQEQQAALARMREQQAQELARKLPAWSDSKTKAEESKQIAEYARSMGVTDEELNNLIDHRQVLILRDAMRYRRAKQAGQQKVKGKKPQTKDAAPGSGQQGDPKARVVKKAKEAIRKRGGKVTDVAPLMGQLLTAKPK